MAKNKEIINSEQLTYSLDQLECVVEKIKNVMKKNTVFAFYGTLGAGKTTVIRKLLTSCGVKEVITSPTFTYMNKYVNDSKEIFYHFDLYRLTSLDEFLELGFDEYLYQEKSWAFIEWPEIILPLIKNDVCEIDIEHGNDLNIRRMKIDYRKKTDN